MSKLLIGISGMAAFIAGGIAGVFGTQSIFFWIFAILSIPFGMAVTGIILIAVGVCLVSPFVGLNQLDQEFERDE